MTARKTTFAALLLTLLAGLPWTARAVTPLVPHVAEYKVRISILGGTLETMVSETGSGFFARSVIKPTGFTGLFINGRIEEQSRFRAGAGGVRPQHYESVDTLSKDGKPMAFEFDWEAGAVSGHIGDEAYRFEFERPVHDRVSIQYELMHNLLNGETAGSYLLLDGDELKHIDVANIGKRRLRVPFGEFDAVGIQHRAQNSSRVNTLWCVEELGFLPIVIEQHRDGKLRVRAELTNYRPQPANDKTVAASEP